MEYRAAYGLKNGHLQFVGDVPRGLACGCQCPECGKALVAKKGLKRRHHFAHLEITDCRGAPESVLHRLAKELLSELTYVVLPQYEFIKRRAIRGSVPVEHRAVIAKGGTAHVDRVRIEQSEGDFVPDVVIESGSRSLIIEVAVSNKVAREKLRRIRKRDLPAIEIRLSEADAFLPRHFLKNKLRDDLASKVWLFHPKQREAEGVFLAMCRNSIARCRNSRTEIDIASPLSRRTEGPQTRSQPVGTGDMYDRTHEEFRKAHGRYPTWQELVKHWPRLWGKA